VSAEKPPPGTDSGATFITRWSRRKSASKVASTEGTAGPTAEAIAAQAGTPLPPAPPQPAPLPPVESLTPESDFIPFMAKGVDDVVKRRALKTLFQDPRFNVMDGLDVYIDDYSKPDPLPEGWLEKMYQVTRLGEYKAPVEEPAVEGAEPDLPAAETAESVAAPADPGEPPAPPSVDTVALESPPPPMPES
jgi:hypothetical protein